ncbi:hypothetical protein [Sporosarcina sp.]|uniref:hypothetical protein n=1 Tax=Sporosarcina sp. TaxID=49982 RepID=UPI00262A149E|nr:hypothetical protein [Sporosarcina sp.]
MNPSELIYFFMIGIPVFTLAILLWFIFRRRKNIAVVLTAILLIGYISYILYYPTMKMHTHAERYEQVTDYLTKNYPERKFTILPEYYEQGYSVGQFDVSDTKTPAIGVTLRVDKKGQVTQTSSWSNLDYPTQQELWREIEYFYGEPYTLDKKLSNITKVDEWIDGELTAFALTIDETPAIALFTYSKEGYGLVDLQQGEREGFVVVESDGYVFVFTDEKYGGKSITKNLDKGKEFTLNIDQQKGRLIVEKQQ